MTKKLILALVLIVVVVALYGAYKPLPDGLDVTGTMHEIPAASIHFFSDKTFIDAQGVRRSEQQIFDELLRMIDGAEQYVLLDFFFYSDFLGTATTSHRQLARELTDALIEKKKMNPDVIIQVITDPINSLYGGYSPVHFEELRAHNISVITTAFPPMRDSNPLYSGIWRVFFRWLPAGNLHLLPNLLDAHKPKVSPIAYLHSFNFKANHRKVALTDYRSGTERGFSVLLTSWNPHDGSSAHSNTAIRVDDALWREILASEEAVAMFSKAAFQRPPDILMSIAARRTGPLRIQLLTEHAIEEKILGVLERMGKGDALDIAMFYLSDREIIGALKEADERGVKIRLLLDPNKDAFGREKNGIPNRPVAHELSEHTSGNTEIRWCNTQGEQCHSKMLIFKQASEHVLILGSANLTRRNLDNLNLETNAYVAGDLTVPAIRDAVQLFETVWTNEPGKTYSLEYAQYSDDSVGKTLWYRWGEASGMSRY